MIRFLLGSMGHLLPIIAFLQVELVTYCTVTELYSHSSCSESNGLLMREDNAQYCSTDTHPALHCDSALLFWWRWGVCAPVLPPPPPTPDPPLPTLGQPCPPSTGNSPHLKCSFHQLATAACLASSMDTKGMAKLGGWGRRSVGSE